MSGVINYYQSPQSSQSKPRRLNLKKLNLGIGVIIFCLGFFHLFNISDLSAKGFILRDLKSQANLLESACLEKEETVNRLQSYNYLTDKTANLNLVAVEEIDYLTVTKPVLALK
ncbi:MAG: hypothetical protein ACOX0C_02870 [Patescibacteria group bacterium]|jgi:hypothetical protein